MDPAASHPYTATDPIQRSMPALTSMRLSTGARGQLLHHVAASSMQRPGLRGAAGRCGWLQFVLLLLLAHLHLFVSWIPSCALGEAIAMPDLQSSALQSGFAILAPQRPVYPEMNIVPFSASERQAHLASASLLRIGTSYASSGTYVNTDVSVNRALMLWLSKVNGDVSNPDAPPTGPGILVGGVDGVRYYVAVEMTTDDSSMTLQQILFDGMAASGRYPLLISGTSPNNWHPSWNSVNTTSLFGLGTSSYTLFDGRNRFVYGVTNDAAQGMFHDTLMMNYIAPLALSAPRSRTSSNDNARTAVADRHDDDEDYVNDHHSIRHMLVYFDSNLGGPAASNQTFAGLNGLIHSALERARTQMTSLNPHAPPLTIAYTCFAPPSGQPNLDAAYWRRAFLGAIHGVRGLRGFDAVLVVNRARDEVALCEGLRASGLLPKFAAQAALLDHEEHWGACEGWHSISSYDAHATFESNIPGSTWVSHAQFVQEYRALWGPDLEGQEDLFEPEWGAGQMMGTLEQISGALYAARSLWPSDIREAIMSLNGTNAFGHLRLSPQGTNEAQEYLMLQVDQGRSRVKTSLGTSGGEGSRGSRAQFPVRWGWEPRVWSGPTAATRRAFLSLGALGLVLVASFAWMLFSVRRSVVVKAFTLSFTLVMLVGVACAFVSVMVQGAVYPVTKHSCRASLMLGHVAFLLVFGPIISRSYRISRIWSSQTTESPTITDRQLFARMGLVALLLVAYLTAWFSGVTPASIPRPTLLINGVNHYVTCNAFGSAWSTVLLTAEGAVLLLGVYLAIRNRNVPLLFRESGSIALVTYNTLVVVAVTVGLVSTVLSEPPSSTPLVGAAMLLVAYVIFALMIVGQLVSVLVLAQQARAKAPVHATPNWSSEMSILTQNSMQGAPGNAAGADGEPLEAVHLRAGQGAGAPKEYVVAHQRAHVHTSGGAHGSVEIDAPHEEVPLDLHSARFPAAMPVEGAPPAPGDTPSHTARDVGRHSPHTQQDQQYQSSVQYSPASSLPVYLYPHASPVPVLSPASPAPPATSSCHGAPRVIGGGSGSDPHAPMISHLDLAAVRREHTTGAPRGSEPPPRESGGTAAAPP